MQLFIFSLIICTALILLLRRIAHIIGFIDHPGGRKQHMQPTPTVGGLSMFLAVFLTLLWCNGMVENVAILMSCAAALVILGVLDDKGGLSVQLRILTQVFLATVVIDNSDGMVSHLGAVLGSNLELGILALPFSVIAYVGGINAMNMIDGADGMAGKMALISTIGVAVIAYYGGDAGLLPLTWAMLGSVFGFLLFNTRLVVKRAWVFMGDAGSMWLGLALSWLLAQLTNGVAAAEPAIALWLFGIPLIDTLIVMFRRLRHKKSPFAADRTHIHHVLEHNGFSIRRTVLILSLVQLALVSIGVGFYFTHAPAWLIFCSFLLLMAIYYYQLRHYHTDRCTNSTAYPAGQDQEAG